MRIQLAQDQKGMKETISVYRKYVAKTGLTMGEIEKKVTNPRFQKIGDCAETIPLTVIIAYTNSGVMTAAINTTKFALIPGSANCQASMLNMMFHLKRKIVDVPLQADYMNKNGNSTLNMLLVYSKPIWV